MRRAVSVFGCGLCLCFLSGCVLPYCAYPTLDYTPQVTLDVAPSEVHAFRVDITKPTADLDVFVGPVYESLSAIPVAHTNEVPAQVKPSVSYGFVVIGVAVNFLTHHSQSVAVRLYRPGYELVEIHSWQRVSRVAWKPASDLKTKEEAVDHLMPLDALHQGSKSSANQAALLFGASEYERLAGSSPCEADQVRLAAKANALRQRAKD